MCVCLGRLDLQVSLCVISCCVLVELDSLVIHFTTIAHLLIKSFYGNSKNRSFVTPRPRRPDRAVYVPRARRSQTTPPPAAFAKSSPSSNNDISDSILGATETNGWSGSFRTAAVISCDTEFSSTGRPNSELVSISFSPNRNHIQAPAETSLNCDLKNISQTNCDQSDVGTTAGIRLNRLSAVNGGSETGVITPPFSVTQVDRMHSTRNKTKTQNGTLRIEDAVAQPFDNRYVNSKDDKDEKELQRASKVSKSIINKIILPIEMLGMHFVPEKATRVFLYVVILFFALL